MEQPLSHELHSVLPPPVSSNGWVPWSSDDSIAQGKISLLALLEIPFAMVLFWWISSISPWPWLTLIGLMAAPLLLLRSPQSIQVGLLLLQTYFFERRDISRIETVALVAVIMTCTTGLSYWLAQQWLPSHTGWALFWRVALLSMLMIDVATAALLGLFGMRPNQNKQTIAITLTSALLGVGAVVFVVVGKLSVETLGMLLGAVTFVAAGMMGPGLVLGTFIRVTGIRMWATINHLRVGIAEFPHNWRETVCVIDPRHLPEILPRAREVSPIFSLKSLLLQKQQGNLMRKLVGNLMNLMFVFLVYLSALLYRWNLKASAWIWGPIAWILRPVVWLDDEEMRSKTAFWTTLPLQSLVGSAVVLLCLWLLTPFLPDSLKVELPGLLQTINTRWPAPAISARYMMLWLLALSLAKLLFSAYSIRAAHAKALEGAGDFQKGYDDELKTRLKNMAVPVRCWLQWNTAIAALTVWVFALWWALQRWPDELQHVVWDWIKLLL